MTASSKQLLSALTPKLAPDAQSWLAAALADGAQLATADGLRMPFARAARKLGSAGELPIEAAGERHSTLDLARAALLLAAVEHAPAPCHVELVEALYRGGEQREQQAILRALPLLPDAARFTEIAVQSCRTNSQTVFRAIACDNTFPADYFPELNFNQLVLKAIFLGVEVACIRKLAERATPELTRMLREYASERRAAGRPIPSDVEYVIALSER